MGFTFLSNLWSRITGRSSKEGDMPFSIILLLRQPSPFSEAQLNDAGERAWRKPFSKQKDSMYCAVEATPTVTLIKSGQYLFSFLQENNFYIGPVEEIASMLPRVEQQNAWRKHTAWAALDLLNRDIPKNEAYAAIARWILQLSDDNCVGIYIPTAQIMMPNDGTAEAGLRKLIKKGPPVTQ